MICCKIIADYENKKASFSGLLKKLSQYAETLWDNNCLYVGEVESDFLNEKKIIKILKLNHYSKFFIDVYSQDNQPKESEYVNGWLLDKIIKINYATYEQKNQQMLKETMIGLNELEKYVDYELSKQKQAKEDNDNATE